MTLYEHLQRERITARILEDIYAPPIHKTVMLVDLRGPNRIRGSKCAVRVQKLNTPVAPEAVLHAVAAVRQSKDRGS